MVRRVGGARGACCKRSSRPGVGRGWVRGLVAVRLEACSWSASTARLALVVIDSSHRK